MARIRNAGRHCLFESLESRQMMAGDVSAQIVNGNLTIKGDASNNNIAVAVAAGAVTITSTDTTINGASATAGVALTGTLTGKVTVNLKGGTDSLTLTGPLTVPGKLDIDNTETVMNTGTLIVNGKMDIDDVSNLTLVLTTVNGKMDIEGTKGVDKFSLMDIKVTGKAEIETGKRDGAITDCCVLVEEKKAAYPAGDLEFISLAAQRGQRRIRHATDYDSSDRESSGHARSGSGGVSIAVQRDQSA